MSKYQIRITANAAHLYDVKLVKALRTVARLGLREAHSLLKYLRSQGNCVLIAGIDQDVAEHAAEVLRDCSAKVTIELSSVEMPMLLHPDAARQYRWHWWSGPTPMHSAASNVAKKN